MSEHLPYSNFIRNLPFEGNSRVDDLLLKNQKIYQNLRSKLVDIHEAEHKISLNLGKLRPNYELESKQPPKLKELKKVQVLNDSYIPAYMELQSQANRFNSSPIATERPMSESIRKKMTGLQPNKTPESKFDASVSQYSSKYQPLSQNISSSASQLRKINEIRWPLGLGVLNSTTNAAILHENGLYEKPFFEKGFKDKSQSNQSMGKEYQRLVDSVRKNQLPVSFEEVNQRKLEIENMYRILKEEEEMINLQYERYKRNLLINSRRSSESKSKVQKQIGFEDDSSPSKIRQEINSNRSSSRSKRSRKSGEKGSSTSNIESKSLQQQFRLSSQIQGLNLTYHENPTSHLFIPFNKLYKSPILQMKNQHQIIVAHHCKTVFKNSDNRIFDGKKYKLSEPIQTNQDELIKRITENSGNHHAVAIVGGKDTLKKTMHTVFLEQFLDHILRFIYDAGIEFNFLTFTLEHNEEIIAKGKQTKKNVFPFQPDKVQVSIEIEPSNIKLCVLEIQKALEEIEMSMKRDLEVGKPRQASLSNAFKSGKKVHKLTRFTSMSLCSQKECLWSGHLISTNDYSAEFVKQLNVRDIVWSVNPLLKNFEEVSKTFEEMERYCQSQRFEKTKKSIFP